MFVVHPCIYLFFSAGEGLGQVLSLVLTLSETMCVTGGGGGGSQGSEVWGEGPSLHPATAEGRSSFP